MPDVAHKELFFAIRRCPVHETFWAVTVERANGSGTRLTAGKCCGQWQLVKRWPLSTVRLQGIDEELRGAAATKRAHNQKLGRAVLRAVRRGRHNYNAIHSAVHGILSEHKNDYQQLHRALGRLRRAGKLENRRKAQGGPGWFVI